MSNVIDLTPIAGRHISAVCEEAVKTLAANPGITVHFVFNDVHVNAKPGQTAEELVSSWERDFEAKRQAWLNSDEYKKREAEREAEDKRKRDAVLVESAQTEADMRSVSAPWPYTEKQLFEYISSLVNRQHDYGTCVYAMSLAAIAAFNYVAHKLGTTGFQSSCADLDFVRRSRHIDGPFMLIKGEDALYPQYDLRRKLEEALLEWTPWLQEQAAEKLNSGETAHPDVVAHWQQLANPKAH